MKKPGRRQHAAAEERNSTVEGTTMPTDAELVGRLRTRDVRAFEILFARYFDVLVRFAYYLVGTRDTSKDIVQDVFIRIWEQPGTLDPSRSLKQYLYAAVRNHALDERKHASVRTRHQEATLAAAEADPSIGGTPSQEDAIVNEATFQAALSKLSDRRREVVRLRIKEQLTHAEIGQILGISTVAASRLVLRALEDLQKILRVSS